MSICSRWRSSEATPIHTELTSRSLILSSTDRSLRVLIVSPETGALAPIHRFQDQINRTNWNSIGFSKDDNSEYVMGGSSNKMGHNVFIWDKDSGVLVKVLEGPKEPLLDSDVSCVCFAASACGMARATASFVRRGS